MRIYDSKTKQPIEITEDEIRLYVCGPTVYDDAHLGHARSAVAFDLLVRTLKALGKKVIFARNITDIDDKILKKMSESGKSLEEITTKYYESYRAEMAALGCVSPDIEPKATESVDDMVELIQTLMDKGFAYATPSGDVYFDASKDDKYLSLSGHKLEETVSRLEKSEKRGEKDFVLWKSAKDGGPVSFDSPFGRGRPGWHIECSAMIKRHLAKEGAYQIDIHGGGSDLLFPHHENEAAQTRCAFNQELSHIWMHNGFVTIGGEKMSKSLGNSFFLRDALKMYDGEIIRFYLLSTHYRANFNFSLEDMDASKKRLDKLYRLKRRIGEATPAEDKKFAAEFLAALEDDLNISKALAVIDERVQAANEVLDKNSQDEAANAAYVISLISQTLGVGTKDAEEYFKGTISMVNLGLDMSTMKTKKVANIFTADEIEKLIQQRVDAKKAKDFAAADAIRQRLTNMGIKLMDTPIGTLWERA